MVLILKFELNGDGSALMDVNHFNELYNDLTGQFCDIAILQKVLDKLII